MVVENVSKGLTQETAEGGNCQGNEKRKVKSEELMPGNMNKSRAENPSEAMGDENPVSDGVCRDRMGQKAESTNSKPAQSVSVPVTI